MSVLFVHSHYGDLPAAYGADARIVPVRERALEPGHFRGVNGVVTTTHLDQVGWLDHVPALIELLDRGGSWFFNGHILRRFLPELDLYVPLRTPRRPDYALTRLIEHPIFAGIAQNELEENKGVAGFYGRGHNPLPPGGVAVNGIGPALFPVDWAWTRPAGGRIFSHAGNDLGGLGAEVGHGAELTRRIIAWCDGEF